MDWGGNGESTARLKASVGSSESNFHIHWRVLLIMCKYPQATGLERMDEFLSHLTLLSQRLPGLSEELQALAGGLR